MATLGEIIKEYRTSFTPKITLEELADKAHVSKSYLSMIENNKDPRGNQPCPSDLFIRKIARAMNMGLDEILSQLDDNHPIIVNSTIDYGSLLPKHILMNVEELQPTKKELELIEKYRKLSKNDKKVIDYMIGKAVGDDEL